MTTLPGKLMLLVSVLMLALCGFPSKAAAEERIYTFVNSSNHEVTLYLSYPPGTPAGPGAITQMKLKPGGNWTYSMNDSVGNIRINLAGGTWKDYKGTAFFVGVNLGAAPGGTYTIK